MAAADYWATAQLDPSYLAQHGSNTKSLIQAILGYGSSAALSPELAAQYGIQPGQVSAADQNPYSTTKQLAQQLSGDQYGITNNANAHGALYSGAHAAAQQHELQNAGQRNYTAQQALASQISGIGQQDTNALTGAYTGIANAALNTPTAPAVPAPVAPATPDFGLGQVIGQPATAAVSAGGPLGSYNPNAPQNQPGSGMVPIKPPKLPNIGGANRSFR